MLAICLRILVKSPKAAAKKRGISGGEMGTRIWISLYILIPVAFLLVDRGLSARSSQWKKYRTTAILLLLFFFIVTGHYGILPPLLMREQLLLYFVVALVVILRVKGDPLLL